MGNGSSKTADQAVANADFPDEASEQVLVQSRNGSSQRHRPGVQGRRRRRRRRASARAKHVTEVESPYAKGNEGQISKDGRSALVTFKVAGDDDAVDDHVDASLAAIAAAQKAHPDLRVEQFGDASAGKALNESFEKDFQRAETLSLPITLLILLVAFGALVAAGVPLLLGITAVVGTLGLIAPISQIVPMADAASSVILLVGLAVGVDYSMFYLRRKMEERDAGRSNEAALEFAAATSGQAVLDLRRHRADRDGRHADRRQRGLHLDGRRHDPRGRRRRARLRDRAPRGALQARRQGREGPRADHRQAPPRQPRRVPRVGLDPRQGARAPGRRRSSLSGGVLVALASPR